jgi:hypothetical protein
MILPFICYKFLWDFLQQQDLLFWMPTWKFIKRKIINHFGICSELKPGYRLKGLLLKSCHFIVPCTWILVREEWVAKHINIRNFPGKNPVSKIELFWTTPPINSNWKLPSSKSFQTQISKFIKRWKNTIFISKTFAFYLKIRNDFVLFLKPKLHTEKENFFNNSN